MTPVPDGYDYRHLVGSRASESDKEFDAERFDELLTDDDRKLLQYGLQISWWAYSDIGHQNETVPSSLKCPGVVCEFHGRPMRI
ncbi:MAG TPA: hypothetical protein VMD58_02610 [Acidobacteriaceae bacterium]|nr:hypothetical protein [Acidobacteriaceae bacterium]